MTESDFGHTLGPDRPDRPRVILDTWRHAPTPLKAASRPEKTAELLRQTNIVHFPYKGSWQNDIAYKDQTSLKLDGKEPHISGYEICMYKHILEKLWL